MTARCVWVAGLFTNFFFNMNAMSPDLVRLLIILMATVVAHFVAYRLLHHAERVAERTDNVLDDALLISGRRPLIAIIWISGLYFSLRLIHLQTAEPLLEHISQIHTVAVIACVAWFLLALIRHYGENTVAMRQQRGEPVDHTSVDGISKLLRIVVVVVSALIILQTLGFSISGLVAFGGVGGLAVGLAAKDLLANFFGGLVVHLDRPFNVGENIRSPDRQIEGTVEQISWRHTRIRAPNMNLLFVPNALFTSIVVENPSRMSNRRIDQTVCLRYEDLPKVEAIVNAIKRLLAEHSGIDQQQTLIVAFDAFADSSLNVTIRAYTRTTALAEFHIIKQDILLHIAAIVKQHDADFAYPTRTLHLHQT